MRLDSDLSFGSVMGLLMNPLETLGDCWDYFNRWMRSRRWLHIIIFSAPFFIIGSLVCIAIVMGRASGTIGLLQWYIELAENEAPESAFDSSIKPPSESVGNEESSAAALLYFRRVLQLENENKRARYYVAAQNGLRGSIVQARKMMSVLAPADDEGYLPAHSWLAVDLLTQKRNGFVISDSRLRHHLEMISKWNDVSAELLMVSAQYFAEKAEKELALSFAQQAVRREPRLANGAAVFAMALGESGSAEQFANAASQYFVKKIEEGDSQESDYLGAAQAHVIRGQLDPAIELLVSARGVFPDSMLLRKALAEVYVEKFKASLKEGDRTFSANWSFLDAALVIDPYCPGVSQQLEMLKHNKVMELEDFPRKLRLQLAEGKASTISHLLLSSLAVKNGDYEQGRQHLATAFGLAPYASVVLNNYAMVLTMVDPPELNKAKELIDEAVERDPTNAENLDSQGRILLLLKDVSNAIASFEKALAIAPERIDTRQALVDAYDKNGLPEMAEAQRQVLKEKLEAKKE